MLSLLAPTRPREQAREAYAVFVAQGRGVGLWEGAALRGQVFLGDAGFASEMQALLEIDPGPEVPRSQRRSSALPIESYFETRPRDDAIWQAYHEGGYTQTCIAQHAELSVGRVTRILRARERLAKGNTCPLSGAILSPFWQSQ